MTEPENLEGAPGAQLVIISGPSGVGKDTIIDALRARPRDPDYHYVVTCTTRDPRPGEVPGASYQFLSLPGVQGAARRGRAPRVCRGPRQLVWHAQARGRRGTRCGP